MSGRTRNFGAAKSVSEFPPLEFVLNNDTFKCRPAVPGRVILQFVADADSDEGGKAALAIDQFLKSSMVETEYARFKTLVDDPDTIVSMETLGEIVGWLVEEYTARPSQAPSSLDSGRTNSGQSSTENAFAPAYASSTSMQPTPGM